MYRLKRRQLSLVLVIFVLFLLINVGYAYLNKDLSISGTTTVNSFSFDVGWDDNYYNSGGSASCDSSIDGDTFNFTAGLVLPGDYCEFSVDIENKGSLPASVSLSMDGSSFSFPYSYNDSSNGYSIEVSYSGTDLDDFGANESGTVSIRVDRVNCDDDDTSCSGGEGSFSLGLSATQLATNF